MIRRSPVRKVRRKPRPGRLKGKELGALKLETFERDGWTCRECRRGVCVDVGLFHPARAHWAHLRGKRMWGDSLENSRTLCSGCHHAEHNPKACPTKPVMEEAIYD